MTAQISDTFKYKGKKYSLAGISEGELFDPELLGLQPMWSSTACWRGYCAQFGLLDNRLVLSRLDVNLANEIREEGTRPRREALVGPEVNGVTPFHIDKASGFFNNTYKDLKYHLEYTGGLLLAKGFIQRLYVHMGFHPAWKYKRVVELVFEGGVLRAEHDLSKRMAEVRELIKNQMNEPGPDDEPTDADIREFVERSFDQSYQRGPRP